MLNRCEFIGNLGKDPEIRHTRDGEVVANFSIACTERGKDQSGEKKERTEWVNVVFFGALAGVADRYLKKGSKVYVAGKQRTEKWQDRDGNDRYTTKIRGRELVMLDSKPRDGAQSQSVPSEAPPADDFDDSIPF